MKRIVLIFASLCLIITSGCSFFNKDSKSSPGGSPVSDDDCTSYLWGGDLVSAPSGPVECEAYYNISDNKAYYWNGTVWSVLGDTVLQNSEDTDGITLTWKGSFSAEPAGCDADVLSWAYYNTARGASMRCDGTAWQALTSDYSIYNQAGLIENGRCLVLNHNLNRSSLTFNAKFLYDGTFWSYEQYQSRFVSYQKLPVSVSSHSADMISSASNMYGNVIIVYRDSSDGYKGKFASFDSSSALINSGEIDTDHVANLNVVSIKNGYFVVVFRHFDGNECYFKIFNADTTRSTALKNFCSDGADEIITPVGVTNSGDFIIAYRKSSDNTGMFVKYNSSGVEQSLNNNVFSTAAPVQIKALPASEGYFSLVYRTSYPAAPNYVFLYQVFSSAGNEMEQAGTVLENCDTPWDEQAVTNVTASADTGDKIEGIGSAVFDVAGVFGSGLVGSAAIGNVDMRGYQAVSFWIKTSGTTLGQDTYRLVLSSTPYAAGSNAVIGLPVIPGDTWTRVVLPLPVDRTGLASIVSIGLLQNGDPYGDTAHTVQIDKVMLHTGYIVDTGVPESPDPRYPVISLAAAEDGNIAMAYKTGTSAGKLAIIDGQSGVVVFRDFFAQNVSEFALIKLADSRLALVYKTWLIDSFRGFFRIYSGSGKPDRGEKLFHQFNLTALSASSSVDGRIFAVYADAEQGNQVMLKLTGDYRLTLERVNNNQVRFCNYSGEPLYMTISVDH